MHRPKFTFWKFNSLLALGLFLSTFGLFARTAQFSFLDYDDLNYVVNNPHVRSGLTPESVAWALTTFDEANWHPLTWLSLELDYRIYGINPTGFHLTNVFWHALNTALLYLVLQRMTVQTWPSAVAAMLFGWHPLHVESVAWVAERKDVLSTFFWLLTLGAYQRYVERPGFWRYLGAFICLALGLMAKPMLVTLPCVLLLLDFWPLRRIAWKKSLLQTQFPAPKAIDELVRAKMSVWQLVVEKVPLFALVAVDCYLTISAQGRWQAITSLRSVPLNERLANVFLVYVDYLGQMFWPRNLAVFYPLTHPSFSDWEVVLAILVVASVSVGAWLLSSRHPYLPVGWFWYLGTLVPVIGLVQVGSQARADRYTYVPLIGIFILCSWLGAEVAARWKVPRKMVAATVAVVLILLIRSTWYQLDHWRNTFTIWEHAIEVTSANATAHHNLGHALVEKGELRAAIAHYDKVLEILPFEEDTLASRGNCFVKLGEEEKAFQDFSDAVQVHPDSFRAHFQLARIYRNRNDLSKAIDHYRLANRLNPNVIDPPFELGLIYLQQGKYFQAHRLFLEVKRLAPEVNMGGYLAPTYLWLGQNAEAARSSREAIQSDPRNAEAFHTLSVALYRQKPSRSALDAATEATRLDPGAIKYHTYRAMMLSELGDKKSARREYDIAAQNDPHWPQIGIGYAFRLATNPDSTQRYGPLAVELALQACQAAAAPNPEFLMVLATAFAECGNMNKAIGVAANALKLGQSSGQGDLVETLKKHLQSYQMGKPIRETVTKD